MNKITDSNITAPIGKALQREGKKIIAELSAESIFKAAICFTLQFSGIFASMSPFSAAFYAATFKKNCWILSMAASVIGCIAAKNENLGIYSLTLAAITSALALCDFLCETPCKRAVTASVLYTALRTVGATARGFIAFDILALLMEGTLLGVCVYVFYSGYDVCSSLKKRKLISQKECICVYTSLAIVLLAADHLPLPSGLGGSSIFSILTIYIMCLASPLAHVLVMAIICGAISTLGSEAGVFAMGTYTFGSLMAYTFRGYGKSGIVLGFVIANTLEIMFTVNSPMGGTCIYNSLFAALLFAIVPKSSGRYFSIIASTDSVPKREYDTVGTVQRLTYLADSLGDLSRIYAHTYTSRKLRTKGCATANDRDSEWIAKTSEAKKLVSVQLKAIEQSVRQECSLIESGNDIHTQDTLWSELDKEGLHPKNISAATKENGDFHITVTYTVESVDKETRDKTQSCVQKVTKCAPEFAGMKKYGGDVVFAFCPHMGYTASFGYASRAKSGEKVCGDSFNVIYPGQNKIAMVLSDGMGSGTNAAAESKITVTLMEKFLKAGFDTDTAIELINSSLLLKGAKESFATLDVCDIDLGSASLSFVKMGASAAYIKSNEKILCIRAKSLPAGIVKEADTEKYMLPFESDTIVLMMSDGVADIELQKPELSGWIGKYLKEINSANPQIIAAKLLERAKKLSDNKVRDDMTVLVGVISKTDTPKTHSKSPALNG